MATANKGLSKVEVMLKWDPSPLGAPDHDLDLMAATFTSGDPHGAPAYLVHFGSRSPDGTITLNRDSRTGQGLGTDEEMTLELDRLGDAYTRVLVGVAIQQGAGELTFGSVAHPHVRVVEDRDELAQYDFGDLAGATAATLAEFHRQPRGAWQFRRLVHGFDGIDADTFGRRMGEA
ncbi:TerD family protein [Streptomyces fuscigenes]|uniref:TerD family protein n=1 Tax=Streptomyces fuscigenes TaxID=1528880 RepID=UPI001F36A4B5|nr:TerD family protein [Streptomyces fuscigenes]MCF3961815.1 TerD family protein [Streptomyces fuscigenes]